MKSVSSHLTGPSFLIADDHAMFAETLRVYLQRTYHVVGLVTDGRTLVEQALKLRPEVIVVDVGKPLLNGLEAARIIHQGRRARMGASMNGPDYVQWHGFYEVAKIFYSEFLPEAEHLLPGVTSEVKESSYHQWLKGLSVEQRQNIREYYEKRYEQPPQ
jgi:hypothetical protein